MSSDWAIGHRQYGGDTNKTRAARSLRESRRANAIGQSTNAVPRTAQDGLQGKSTGLGIDITPPNKRRDGGPVLERVPEKSGVSPARAEALAKMRELRGSK